MNGTVSYAFAAGAGVLIGIFGQVSDIAESMLKRAVEAINPRFSIETRIVPFSVLLEHSSAGLAPVFVLGWSPDYPDPHNFAFAYMHTYGKYPRAQKYSNPSADELIAAARLETDPAKRERLYFRLQRIAAYARILPLINYENRQCGLRATKTVMMEGGVIKCDAVRHPLEALHPATRKGLLELAREADPLALRWGK